MKHNAPAYLYKLFICGALCLGMSSLFQSCCTKVYCIGFGDMNEVHFEGFGGSELDSVNVEIFAKGTGERLDSVLTSAQPRSQGDTILVVFLPGHINKEHEYKLTLDSKGMIYRLRDFETVREECSCPGDKYEVLTSYSVNGQKESGSTIVIKK